MKQQEYKLYFVNNKLWITAKNTIQIIKISLYLNHYTILTQKVSNGKVTEFSLSLGFIGIICITKHTLALKSNICLRSIHRISIIYTFTFVKYENNYKLQIYIF